MVFNDKEITLHLQEKKKANIVGFLPLVLKVTSS